MTGISKLVAEEVHVWRVHLVAQTEKIRAFRDVLSVDEIERADRFHFERDRTRFVIGRAAMRYILSQYLGVGSAEVEFSYGPKGKPELSSAAAQSGITFNLSHSHDYALLAVARETRLGVDLEFVKPEFATEEIATRFFSAKEAELLCSLPPSARAEAFFSCWTRKEAYIKALGEGMTVPLNSFDVAFVPGVPAALLHVNVDPCEVMRWSMYDIKPVAGYKAALVAEGKKHRLRQLHWESELFR